VQVALTDKGVALRDRAASVPETLACALSLAPVGGSPTVVADAAGRLRYVIAKPLNAERRDEQKRFVRLCDREDAMLAWGDDTWEPHVVNHFYLSSFPAPVPSSPGKNVGWTDWTLPRR